MIKVQSNLDIKFSNTLRFSGLNLSNFLSAIGLPRTSKDLNFVLLPCALRQNLDKSINLFQIQIT